jgi:hypothetical protein
MKYLASLALVAILLVAAAQTALQASAQTQDAPPAWAYPWAALDFKNGARKSAGCRARPAEDEEAADFGPGVKGLVAG